MTTFDLTVYMLAGALVLVAAFDRVLNTAFFTVQTSLYDQSDALVGLGQAALLYVLTSMTLKQLAAAI